MARPIWTGTLSFGLLNVPVSLMSGERKVDLSFRMLDSRDNARVRYERVNADTGEEVPWKDIVKAFEYDKGSYVVLEDDDFKAAASEGREAVEVEAFVDAAAIAPQFYEKPYILVPGRKAEKGYVLLRETLKATGRAGIARVVIRTREYLAAVLPQGDALMLNLLRYPQELVDVEDFKLPEGNTGDYRISAKELQMARQLIESMAGEWTPTDYRDEFRGRLQAVIDKKMKNKGALAQAEDPEQPPAEDATTNVVDFMSLLKQSIASNKRTPASGDQAGTGKSVAGRTPSGARKSAGKKAPVKKAPASKTAARKAPAKKAPAKKSASTSAKAGTRPPTGRRKAG
jgi:DNA end-binding protein Ku